jgi:hypothetical protein
VSWEEEEFCANLSQEYVYTSKYAYTRTYICAQIPWEIHACIHAYKTYTQMDQKYVMERERISREAIGELLIGDQKQQHMHAEKDLHPLQQPAHHPNQAQAAQQNKNVMGAKVAAQNQNRPAQQAADKQGNNKHKGDNGNVDTSAAANKKNEEMSAEDRNKLMERVRQQRDQQQAELDRMKATRQQQQQHPQHKQMSDEEHRKVLVERFQQQQRQKQKTQTQNEAPVQGAAHRKPADVLAVDGAQRKSPQEQNSRLAPDTNPQTPVKGSDAALGRGQGQGQGQGQGHVRSPLVHLLDDANPREAAGKDDVADQGTILDMLMTLCHEPDKGAAEVPDGALLRDVNEGIVRNDFDQWVKFQPAQSVLPENFDQMNSNPGVVNKPAFGGSGSNGNLLMQNNGSVLMQGLSQNRAGMNAEAKVGPPSVSTSANVTPTAANAVPMPANVGWGSSQGAVGLQALQSLQQEQWHANMLPQGNAYAFNNNMGVNTNNMGGNVNNMRMNANNMSNIPIGLRPAACGVGEAACRGKSASVAHISMGSIPKDAAADKQAGQSVFAELQRQG